MLRGIFGLLGSVRVEIASGLFFMRMLLVYGVERFDIQGRRRFRKWEQWGSIRCPPTRRTQTLDSGHNGQKGRGRGKGRAGGFEYRWPAIGHSAMIVLREPACSRIWVIHCSAVINSGFALNSSVFEHLKKCSRL